MSSILLTLKHSFSFFLIVLSASHFQLSCFVEYQAEPASLFALSQYSRIRAA